MRGSITVAMLAAVATAVPSVVLTVPPAGADEVALQYEEFTFTATVTLPSFPCPTGCAATGHLEVDSATGGPTLIDSVNVSVTDSFGCVAGSLELYAGTASQLSTTTIVLTRAGAALVGQAIHDEYALPRTRTYQVEAAIVPSSADPAGLAVACAAGTPLRNLSVSITGVGERVAVRTS